MCCRLDTESLDQPSFSGGNHSVSQHLPAETPVRSAGVEALASELKHLSMSECQDNNAATTSDKTSHHGDMGDRLNTQGDATATSIAETQLRSPRHLTGCLRCRHWHQQQSVAGFENSPPSAGHTAVQGDECHNNPTNDSIESFEENENQKTSSDARCSGLPDIPHSQDISYDGLVISAQREFQSSEAHEFWTWSIESQNWYHVDCETGTIVWAPLDFD